MKFPDKKYLKIDEYLNDYSKNSFFSLNNIDKKKLNKCTKILEKAYKNKKKLFVCGNGGSSALANHFACDHQKILSQLNKFYPRIISLNSNDALLTAISNDVNYENIFSDQVDQLGDKGDFLLCISSSGKSKNVVNATKMAKKKGIYSISFTGFDGGYLKNNSDLNIHCNSKNYGIIEACHHSIMNIIAQFIRQSNISSSLVKETIF